MASDCDKRVDDESNFKPRDYQVQMMGTALKKNTIIFLPTGSGKTYIAVMLIKRMSKSLLLPDNEGRKITVILVNTVTLVHQHYSVLEKTTPFKIGCYTGDQNVDLWTDKDWQAELDKYQVFIMTAQIFLNNILHDFMSLSMVNLLVFDECHHGVNKHPMREIMKRFKYICQPDQPRVLGLTATLLNSTCKPSKVMTEVKELETTFLSSVSAVDDISRIACFSTNPKEQILKFEKHVQTSTEKYICESLEKLWDLLQQVSLKKMPTAHQDYINNMEISIVKEPKDIKQMIRDTTFHIEELGIYGASLAIKSQLIKIECMKLRCGDAWLQKILIVIYTKFVEIIKLFSDMMNGYTEIEKIMKFSSSKVVGLIDLLEMNMKTYGKNLCCIIFVQRRFTAKCIFYILNKLQKHSEPFYEVIPDFVVGFNASPMMVDREVLYTSKMYKKIIHKFKNKEVDILVASSVVEEGIDIPHCKLVIKYDFPISYRSYVQSKGRARHDTSNYFMMIDEQQYGKFVANIEDYKAIERILISLLVGKSEQRIKPNDKDIMNKLFNANKQESYYVDGPNSATVTLNSSISLVCRYAQTLFCDRYTQYDVTWNVKQISLDSFQATIELPLASPIKAPIIGNIMQNKNLAKASAALMACKLLHQSGELNDKLLPRLRSEVVEEDSQFLFAHWPAASVENDAMTGNKKMRRIYPIRVPRCQRGQVNERKPLYLHLLILKPQFNDADLLQSHQMSILTSLYGSELHYGLVSAQRLERVCDFPVFVSQGEISVSVSVNYQTIILRADQIKAIRRFHHLVFNDIVKVVKSCLVLNNDPDADMLLVVPVRNYKIAFDVVENNVAVEEIVEPNDQDKVKMVVNNDTHFKKIVCPWYRSKATFYVVTQVCESLTPSSSFPSTCFESFEHYYKATYNESIKKRTQPLLLVKALSQRLNCLKPRGLTGRKAAYNSDDFDHTREEHLIPELCVKFNFPSELWVQANLLPSVLYKLNQFLRVNDLRNIIANECSLGMETLPAEQAWKTQTVDPLAKQKRNKPVAKVDKNEDVTKHADITETMEIENIKKLNQDFASKLLEAHFPWKDTDEPMDIYKNIEDVTEFDIIDYVKFISNDVTIEERSRGNVGGYHGPSTTVPALTFPRDYEERVIKLLEPKSSVIGVQLTDIYQAFSTAKANDVVNLERFETLGDSFLKFSVSLYVLQKFLSYDEGKLTIIKGKIISNKNLFYVSRRKKLEEFIKNMDFEPSSQWLPPGYKIPTLLEESIRNKEIPVHSLYSVIIPNEDQIAGVFNPRCEILDVIDDSTDSNNELCNISGKQILPDKTIADTVEALIGVYFQEYGVDGTMSLLNWLGIIPPIEQASLLYSKSLSETDINFHIPSYKLLEERLGYSFKNPVYLLQALTHASYTPNRLTSCYQRLEFLGDAVLDFLITCYIYESCDDLTPGDLTDLRSALVNNVTFAALTVRNGFHKHLLAINHLLTDQINNFDQFQKQRDYSVDDEILILLEENDNYIAEHIDVPKVLGDLFESLAGAVFLDSGMCLRTVWKVFYKLMWKEIDLFSFNVPKNVVRLLYETKGAHPKFLKARVLDSGTTMISLEVMVNGEKKFVHGFGNHKHNAKQAAAKIALRLINITNHMRE